MRLLRSLTPLALALFASFAPDPARAGSERAGTLRWRGEVDGTTVIEFRGKDAQRRRGRPQDDDLDVAQPLPRSPVYVYVRPLRGKALVSVDEQPDRGNDYTASIVVSTDRDRVERVEFELLWLDERPGDRPGGRGDSDYGSDRDRDRVDRDQDQDRDRDDRDERLGGARDKLVWRGKVDGSDYIDVRGRSVTVRHLSHLPVQAMSYDLTGPLPEEETRVRLVRTDGRGTIRIVTQPNATNQYTATVLVDDRNNSGTESYEFVLDWPRPVERVGRGEGPVHRLSWTGFVDGKDVLVVRGDQVEIEHMSGRAMRNPKPLFTAPLPQRELPVSLRRIKGRGYVVIEQQPTAVNKYTLRVRLDDEESGDDFYSIELSWPQ